jgi:lysophospholipase L1-like esterase
MLSGKRSPGDRAPWTGVWYSVHPMARRRHALLALGQLCFVACGGTGGPTQPTPPPEPTYPVTAVVFYDENGNGVPDPSEAVRLPQVDVVVQGVGSAKTAAITGQAVVMGVKAGSQSVAIRTESLPMFYVPGPPVSVQVPQTGVVNLPVVLPIGSNQPNVYMAFGDSITNGLGSSDGNGYRLRLQNLLGPYLGRAQVNNEGKDGSRSNDGAYRIPGRLYRNRPAYTLIHYGTNDWQDPACQIGPPSNCFTLDSLRSIVDQVKADQSLPVLATLIPTNPAVNPSENLWINQINPGIKALASQEGALLADLNAVFMAQGGDLSRFFADGFLGDVHPNDLGYDLMAQGFFKALTQARSATASGVSSSPYFGFTARGGKGRPGPAAGGTRGR